jgi:transcriptional regulator MraZ
MVIGQHQLLLEKDHQLAVPENFRELFTEGAFVTRGFEQNLLIFSARVFQELVVRITRLSITDPLARLLNRLIIGNASKLELSDSGQVFIPEALRSVAGLEKDIIMVGQGNYCEVWARPDWEKQVSNMLDTGANSQRFAHLDLTLQL